MRISSSSRRNFGGIPSCRRNFAEGSLAATQTIVCLRGKGGNHSELNEIEFILRILREECEVTGGSSVSNAIRKK